MKPKPLESLNHLTVPVAIAFPILVSCAGDPAIKASQPSKELQTDTAPLLLESQRGGIILDKLCFSHKVNNHLI